MVMFFVDSWQLRGKIKRVIKSVTGKGFYCPDNEFLIDVALAFPYPVNLAYQYTHNLH